MSRVLVEPVGSEPPDLAHEGVACDDGPGLAQQDAQQVEFLGCQAQLDVADEGAVGGDVHADVLGAQLTLGGLGDLAAQEGAHAGEELDHGERFGEIAVRTAVEPADHVFLGAFRREDENGRADRFAAQGAHHVEAVAVGHHDVEHDAVVRAGFAEVERRLAVVDGIDLVPIAFEHRFESAGHVLLVVGY